MSCPGGSPQLGLRCSIDGQAWGGQAGPATMDFVDMGQGSEVSSHFRTSTDRREMGEELVTAAWGRMPLAWAKAWRVQGTRGCIDPFGVWRRALGTLPCLCLGGRVRPWWGSDSVCSLCCAEWGGCPCGLFPSQERDCCSPVRRLMRAAHGLGSFDPNLLPHSSHISVRSPRG